MNSQRTAEVAIVGGGPAGAALAIRLADAGVDVVLFERQPEPRWRASGVYSSPRTRGMLAALGLDRRELDRLIMPIAAMEVRTLAGAACRLDHAPPYACGLDRVRLERALLDRAAEAGARILEGHAVRDVGLPAGREGALLTVAAPEGTQRWSARMVVGADGPRSVVARAAGIARPARRFRRAGLTVHHHDPGAPVPGEAGVATLTVGPGWYCAAAPVPGARMNVGMVTTERALRDAVHHGEGAAGLLRRTIERLPGPVEPWRGAPRTDAVQVALPLAHRPARLAGPGHLLVGDAAGFIDPLSGEGLGRAMTSAALAAGAVMRWRTGGAGALSGYDRAMRIRFMGKDAVSWLLQGFLADPRLTGYALDRLDRRPGIRRTFTEALTDLVPAHRLLDPRYLARLLAP